MVSPVEPAELPQALARALRGGPPIAPLPTDPIERQAALTMLRPELPVEEPDPAAVVATSGSTGRPKGVVLSRAAVVASVEATHARLGGPGDWLAALPGHYVAGLMVHARAIVAGTEVREIGSDLRELPALTAGPAPRPRYLSVVATQLTRALDDHVLTQALTRVDAVLLGGGPAPAELLARAADAGVRVVTTYGMSETCGGCVYDGRPLDGVDVALDGSGRISVAGPPLFSGYRLRPDLSAEVLQRGRYVTSDRGRWRDGRLELLGRVDDVVVSGGLNVDLGAVEAAARSWPGSRAGDGTGGRTGSPATTVALGVPDPEWGTLVVAVTDAPTAEHPGLRAHLASVLPAHAVPRRIVHRDAIPRTGGGKIDRHRLRTELIPPAVEREGDR